jgi:hypothetical protein
MSKTSAIGRQLRRFLGALLSMGFGAAWWSFIPATVIAVPMLRLQASREATPIALRMTTANDPLSAQARIPKRHPRRPQIVRPVVVIEPPPVPVVVINDPVKEPVIGQQPEVLIPEPDPFLEPITTRSS